MSKFQKLKHIWFDAMGQKADDKDKKHDTGVLPKLLSDALAVGFSHDLGHDYLDDSQKRFEYYHNKEFKLPFDLDYFNRITDGGITTESLNIIVAGTGCFLAGTKVLMANGSRKCVEDIGTGEKLMGPDGTARTILGLIRGQDKIYRITNNNTKDYFDCNPDHILSLTNKNDEIVNISVKEYLEKDEDFKKEYVLYYNKTPLTFSKKKDNLPLEPYFLGLYIGDGHVHDCKITNADIEIENYLKEFVKENNLKLNTYQRKDEIAKEYGITNPDGRNIILKKFKSIGINLGKAKNNHRITCDSKFIPESYKISSIKSRLELLAGLIDSDGCLKCPNSTSHFKFTNTSKRLCKDVIFVARSLGFYVTLYTEKRTPNKNHHQAYCVNIFVNNDLKIPTLVPRKQHGNIKCKPLYKDSFTVELISENDDFFGFQLDKDRLFLLDNFLVTHNSGKSLSMCHFATSYLKSSKNVLYITLEMADKKIAERIDANLFNVPIQELKKLTEYEYSHKIDNLRKQNIGILKIKEYPTAGASVINFKNFIDELALKKNYKPDIIIVDYLGIVASSRFRQGSQTSSYTYMKSVAEELRGLSMETKIPIITGAQLNRGGQHNTDADFEDVGESHGISQTADFMIAMISTEELEQMNQVMWKQIKNRYNDPTKYKRFVTGIDRSKMRLYNVEQSAQPKNIESEVDEKEDVCGFDKGKFGQGMKAERGSKYSKIKFN